MKKVLSAIKFDFQLKEKLIHSENIFDDELYTLSVTDS